MPHVCHAVSDVVLQGGKRGEGRWPIRMIRVITLDHPPLVAEDNGLWRALQGLDAHKCERWKKKKRKKKKKKKKQKKKEAHHRMYHDACVASASVQPRLVSFGEGEGKRCVCMRILIPGRRP